MKSSSNGGPGIKSWILPSIFGILAILFVVVAFARSYFLEEANILNVGQLVSFREIIDHPALLAVTSKLTTDGVADFTKALKSENHDNTLDSKIIDQSFYGADVFIFILSDWSDAALLPSRDEFYKFYDDVLNLKQKDVKRVYQLEPPGGSPRLVIFYKIDLSTERDLLCLAKDIVLEIYSSDTVEKATHYSCSSGV